MSSAITALPLPRTRTHTGRVTQLRVALSEWTKLRTLRSTRYSLLAGVAMTIGFAHLLGPSVRVNAVVPGRFLTDVSKHWDHDALVSANERTALRRSGAPDIELHRRRRLQLHRG